MRGIKVIIPNAGMDAATLHSRAEMLSQWVSRDIPISVECIETGPVSIESLSDEVMAGRAVLRQGVRAEKEGFDAVVVYCFSDLAVHALRENVSIPVVGPGAVTIAAAGMQAVRFTVITTASKNLPRTLRRLGEDPVCREKMAAVRPLDIPVEALRADPSVTQRRLEAVCREAVEQDGADTILLGCLGFAQYGQPIQEKLGVRVLDPSALSVAWAELCIRTGLCHGPLAYPRYERSL